MGMFDYLTVSTKLLPLNELEKRFINDDTDWQTKSLDCRLEPYYITDEGELQKDEYEQELVEETRTNSLLPFYLKTIKVTRVKINHTGAVMFYRSLHIPNFITMPNMNYYTTYEMWLEFVAFFVEGKLLTIQRAKDDKR